LSFKYTKLLSKNIRINNKSEPGVVASPVIPCDGTVEIVRLDAVNPLHTSTLTRLAPALSFLSWWGITVQQKFNQFPTAEV